VTAPLHFRTAAGETGGDHRHAAPSQSPERPDRRVYAILARWDAQARVEGTDTGSVWYSRNSVDLDALPPVVLFPDGPWIGRTARLIDTGARLDAVIDLDDSADSDAVLGLLDDWSRIPLLPRYEGHVVARVGEDGATGLEYIGGRLVEIAIVPSARFDIASAYAPGTGPEYW